MSGREYKKFVRHQEAVSKALIAHAEATGKPRPRFSERHDVGARAWREIHPDSQYGEPLDLSTPRGRLGVMALDLQEASRESDTRLTKRMRAIGEAGSKAMNAAIADWQEKYRAGQSRGGSSSSD